jgi:hypothetical protein
MFSGSRLTKKVIYTPLPLEKSLMVSLGNKLVSESKKIFSFIKDSKKIPPIAFQVSLGFVLRSG